MNYSCRSTSLEKKELKMGRTIHTYKKEYAEKIQEEIDIEVFIKGSNPYCIVPKQDPDFDYFVPVSKQRKKK